MVEKQNQLQEQYEGKNIKLLRINAFCWTKQKRY